MGNRVVRFEIGCRDTEKSKAFFGALFDWRIEGAGPGLTIDTGSGAGGKRLVGPIPLPTGSFAWFADPEGNTIGLWQPAK